MSTWDQLLGMIANLARPTSTPQTPPTPNPPGPGRQAPMYRDNPDEMFSVEQNLARYQQYAKPGPYITQLSPAEEQEFQQWLASTPYLRNPQQYLGPNPDYDIRGFWKAMKAGDPNAQPGFNAGDKSIHLPDTWKTPGEATFSNESIYALPNAPKWRQDQQGNWQFVLPTGHVIFDDRKGVWYGMPKK